MQIFVNAWGKMKEIVFEEINPRSWTNLHWNCLRYFCKLRKVQIIHCIKSVRIRNFSGPYFPAFGLNMARYYVSPHIQFKCGEIPTRKTPNTDTFHAVIVNLLLLCCHLNISSQRYSRFWIFSIKKEFFPLKKYHQKLDHPLSHTLHKEYVFH